MKMSEFEQNDNEKFITSLIRSDIPKTIPANFIVVSMYSRSGDRERDYYSAFGASIILASQPRVHSPLADLLFPQWL